MVHRCVELRSLVRERGQPLAREGGEFCNVQHRAQLGCALVGKMLYRRVWSGGERRSECPQRASDSGKEIQDDCCKARSPGVCALRGKSVDLAMDGLHSK